MYITNALHHSNKIRLIDWLTTASAKYWPYMKNDSKTVMVPLCGRRLFKKNKS